jgi:glutamyl/glutaminyl-tRNA synthetase
MRRIGVAVIIIGHVKNRELTDIATGTTYQTLTSDVEKVYFNLLKKKMHFLGLAYYDRTIITEKTGKKNVVTKKDITVNKISEQTRKIKFRDDNMALDSGSRFADIVDEIPMTADDFVIAVTDAIKAEQSKSGKSFDETKAEQEAKEAEKLKEIAKAEQNKKEAKKLEDVVSKITDFIKENKSNMDKIKPIIAKSKELGYDNPTLITDIDDANKVLALIS